jgi:hypothetical protein
MVEDFIMEIQAKNPRRTKDDSIDIELNHPSFGWITFTASPDDVEQHGRALYNMANAGDFGEVAPYIETTESQE